MILIIIFGIMGEKVMTFFLWSFGENHVESPQNSNVIFRFSRQFSHFFSSFFLLFLRGNSILPKVAPPGRKWRKWGILRDYNVEKSDSAFGLNDYYSAFLFFFFFPFFWKVIMIFKL